MERVLALQALSVSRQVAPDAGSGDNGNTVSSESNACSAQSASPISCGNVPPEMW